MVLSSYRRVLVAALVGATVAVMPTGAEAAAPPYARTATYVVQAGTPSLVSLSYLADGTTWTVTTSPEHGTIDDCSDGACRYTSDPGFTGEDALTYTVDGPGGSSDPGVVRFMVRPNQPPVVYDLHYLVTADQPLTWYSGAFDGADPLQTAVESTPEHGSVTCDGRKCTYEPATGFLGTDSFTWRVSDGEFTSRLATTRLTVTENRAPSLFDTAAVVRSGARVRVQGAAADPEAAHPISYSVAQGPAHGKVVDCDSVGCSYVADEGYLGADSFTWTASDGHLTSREARVSVSVRRNAPPKAEDRFGTAYAGYTTTLSQVGYDVDDDPLTIELVTPAKHGTTVCSGDKCSYTPDADFAGPDSISYRLDDGQSRSRIATMSYTVIGPRPPRVSSFGVVAVSGRTRWIGMGVTSQFPNSNVEIEIVDAPEHGTVLGCDRSVCAYRPGAGYTGTDSFTWRAVSAYGASPTATMAITVNSNRAPVAHSSTHVQAMGHPGLVRLNASDPESDDLRYTVVTQPAHGALGQCYRTCLYTPDPEFTGSDSFQWKVSDGSLESQVVTDTITVHADQPPTLTGRSDTVISGSSVHVPFPAGVDPEDWLPSVKSLPEHGFLSQCSFSGCRYQPDPGFAGVDSFTVVGTSGMLQSEPATFTVDVRPNTAPTLADATLRYPADFNNGESFLLPVTDDTPLRSSVHVVEQPSHGVVTHCGIQSCFYVPDPGFSGVDTLRIRTTDGLLESRIATIGIQVGEPADLQVDLSPSSSSAKTGDQVSWQATVRNLGGQAATGAKVEFTIPTTAKVDRRSLPDDCRTSIAAKSAIRVTCRLHTLDSHQTRRMSLTTALLAHGPATVRATATSPPDLAPDNNTAYFLARVLGPSCTIVGTFGNDRLRGTAGRDVLCGLGGDDELLGDNGRDDLRGGSGADVMTGGPGFDVFLGGLGHDRIVDGPH